MLPALDDRDEFPELSKPDRKAEKDASEAKIKVGTAKQVAILKVKELAQMKHISFEQPSKCYWDMGSSQKFDLELISRQDYRAKYAELRRLQKSAKTLRNNVDDKKSALIAENKYRQAARKLLQYGGVTMKLDACFFDEKCDWCWGSTVPISVGIEFGQLVNVSHDDEEDTDRNHILHQALFREVCVIYWDDFEKIRKEPWMKVFVPAHT